jgi:hypothetical protein
MKRIIMYGADGDIEMFDWVTRITVENNWMEYELDIDYIEKIVVVEVNGVDINKVIDNINN